MTRITRKRIKLIRIYSCHPWQKSFSYFPQLTVVPASEQQQGSDRSDETGEKIRLRVPEITLRAEESLDLFAAVGDRHEPFENLVERRESEKTCSRAR
jgi:hypothetical protein